MRRTVIFLEEEKKVFELAAKLGFENFTELQRKIFSDEKFYNLSKWLFVLGATSSGKTLVALMAYFFEQQLRAEKNLPYKMLFAVPYRALASQKTLEINAATKALGLQLRIYQSTSEYLADDEKIFNGAADIVIIITEKVFMFASMDAAFLDRYDLLVLDEISLVKDSLRGIKTDFVLLHALQRENLRVIALGTPFFSWRNYIEKFGFVLFKEDERPIKIVECPVTYDDEKICAVGQECRAVSAMDFCASDFFQARLETQQKVGETHLLIMIAEVCRYHLRRKERILIFINHREDVRNFARALSKELAAKKILAPTMTKDDCRDYIQKKIQADTPDILCGIMDAADYFAFACGVSYHNANMFSALRSLIEEDFLSEDGRLKIVFSTETLAYGINSNADVVIIPRMTKLSHDRIQSADEKKNLEDRFLYPNEYMNYCGRAGRLTAHRVAHEQKTIGLVYPFICANHFKKNREKDSWLELQKQIQNPADIASNFFETNSAVNEFRPLYILSLFSMFEKNRAGVSTEQLEELIKNLPAAVDENFSEETVEVPVKKLLERKLIYQTNDDDEDESPRFKPTDIGKALAGFVISLGDYDRFLSDVSEYVTEKKFFEVDMFFSVVRSSEVVSAAKSNLGELSKKRRGDDFLRGSLSQMKLIFLRFRQQTTSELHSKLMNDIGKFQRLLDRNNFDAIYKDDDFKVYRVLAATLLWFSDNCSPTRMYSGFKIYYEAMHRIIEIVSYRLDVIRIALPLVPAKRGGSLHKKIGMERLEKISARIAEIIDKIMFFPSQELCDFLGIDYCDLYKAQKMRDVGRLYELLQSSKENRARKAKEISRLATGMKDWINPSWRKKFIQHFGGELLGKKF